MERNARSVTIRKEGRDEGLTPTEQHQKDVLMRQFVKVDGPKGATKAYQDGWERIFGAGK